ncbi:hypothetical protein ACIOD2_32130 [Amycolatopsis sp. NPDC088138]|uniref:hypothetical protein n=1 Tax=Amycolatopsis sp. NPDC088138 TaxID=3363938 RepID=UPI00380126AA
MDEQIVPKSLAARVRAGVEFLDEKTPGWSDCVQVIDLDMRSTCRCVLGQVYGNFDRADLYFFGADEHSAIALGFDANYNAGRAEYPTLQRLWSFVIRQRQVVSQ